MAPTRIRRLGAIRVNRLLRARSDIANGSLIADGPLLGLPAGALLLAIGLERRQETSGHEASVLLQSEDEAVFQQYRRIVNSGFGEIELPLLGADEGHIRQRLRLNVGAHFDEYSDFGFKASPMGRLAWTPLEFARFRASWGRSFRVPPLDELYDSSQDRVYFAYLPDPNAPAQRSLVLIRDGANPHLKAETATTWTAGLDLAPVSNPGLKISWTWFAVDYRNRITQPASDDPDNILAQASEWAPFIVRNPTVAQVGALCESPAFTGLRSGCLASSPAAIVDDSLTNLASTRESGIDLNARQSVDSRSGTFRFSVDAARLLRFEQAATALSPAQNVLNTVGNPLALRMRTAVEWHLHRAEQDGPGVRTAIYYTGDYRNPGSLEVPHVRSATTADLQLFERTPGSDHWWADTRVSLSIQNIFNEAPPFVDNLYGYDIANAQPLGRTISVLLTKDW